MIMDNLLSALRGGGFNNEYDYRRLESSKHYLHMIYDIDVSQLVDNFLLFKV